MVLPSLAKEVGLNEAIFLQQLHYWLQESQHLHDGHKWVYNTYEQWQEQFPFWSISTVRRIVAKLEKTGYIVSSQFNKLKIDHTKWYTIDYSKLEGMNSRFVQHEQVNDSDWTDDHVNMNRPLPEITTESTYREMDDEGVQAQSETRDPSLQNMADLQTEGREDISHRDDDARTLEQLFIQRRGRGMYPSAMQAIQEVVQSGIDLEDAVKWLNEAFDLYQPRYQGDVIHSFTYVKQFIFHKEYLKQERDRASKHVKEQEVHSFSKSRYPAVRRREVVPEWLEKQQQMEQQETVISQSDSDFEEEKAKLMVELAQYKKRED
jgi:hypothetical protein